MSEPYSFKISIQYEEALFKRAIRTYTQGKPVWRRSLIAILLLSPVALILEVMLILKYYPPSAWSYPNQVIGASVLILLPLLCCWCSRQLTKQVKQQLLARTVRMFFGPKTFRFQCELADSEINWRLLLKAQTGSDIWLLFPSPLTFYRLPVEALTPEMQDYILARLRENGVPIRTV